MKPSEVLQKLEQAGLTLGSVESLTGGLFASSVCSIPGASQVFKGAIVTYANEEKINLVHVKASDIEKDGVVSSSVAKEMAIGGLQALNVNLCVSFTGNAGPSVEPGGAQVGEVYMALAYKNFEKEISLPFHMIFSGGRNEIRESCVSFMFQQIDDFLQSFGKKCK